MKRTNALKSVLALALSMALVFGIVGGFAPVSTHAAVSQGTITIKDGESGVVTWTPARDNTVPYSGTAASWISEYNGGMYKVLTINVPAGTRAGTYTVNLTSYSNYGYDNVDEYLTVVVTNDSAHISTPVPKDSGDTPIDPAVEPGKSTSGASAAIAIDPFGPYGPFWGFPREGADGHTHQWVNVVNDTYQCSICDQIYNNVGGHNCNFQWYVTRPATETDDGEACHMCTICGAVDLREPVGGYYLFSQNTETKIKKAPYGGTVTVETPRWLSFQGYVMDALASRPDVTLNVKFREKGYKGGEFKTVTIPAGYDAASLKDANGYTGFLYLAGLFGAN